MIFKRQRIDVSEVQGVHAHIRAHPYSPFQSSPFKRVLLYKVN